jgi:hypothetical protein
VRVVLCARRSLPRICVYAMTAFAAAIPDPSVHFFTFAPLRLTNHATPPAAIASTCAKS